MFLRRFIGPLLCVIGSEHLLALDCEQAQKTILSLSEDSQAQLVVDDVRYEDQAAFVASKPEIKAATITTGSFVTSAQGYEQLWCKLKSQEAALASNKWKIEGPTKDCAVLNRLQLEEASGSSDLESLGIAFASDKDFGTGAQWAPSSVIVTKKDGKATVQSMRLKSPNWLPVIGGMNYCKILSPAGALQLIQEQQKPRVRSTSKIEWNGGLGFKQSALVWLEGDLKEALEAAKATFIISPGAEVPPEAMSGLAERLRQLGYFTLLIQYPNNTAIIDNVTGRGNSAINLARKIKTAPEDIKGLDATALQGKPLYVIGHSLGGATLADEVFRSNEASVFDHIFLYGTASFVKFGNKAPTSSPLTLLFGENDGLSQKDIPGILKSFDIAYDPSVFTPVTSTRYANINYQRLQGLNHFCIISDQSVGNGMLKKKDGAGLEPEACLQQLIQAMDL